MQSANNHNNFPLGNIDLSGPEHDFSFVGAAVSSGNNIDIQNAIGRYTARIEAKEDRFLAVSKAAALMRDAGTQTIKIITVTQSISELPPEKIRSSAINANRFGKELATAMADTITATPYQNNPLESDHQELSTAFLREYINTRITESETSYTP